MLKFIQTGKGLLVSIVTLLPIITYFLGAKGLIGSILDGNATWFFIIYTILMTHITISAMSISFHRYHTHKGVILNPVVDFLMQFHLWIVTSMSKLDWVSVHMYHHAHSDTENDPHSPVVKGFWHVFLKGVWDYNTAKYWDDVVNIRKRLPANRYENFIAENQMLGPYVLTAIIIILFGFQYGLAISVINYLISPIFAVGGVNALAHFAGYKNHKSGDNSRNIGFLVPLNWMICGELDHNNHHAKQKSCSFRHKWYEFDIGYVYIKLMSYMKLADIKNAYTPKQMHLDIKKQFHKLLEKNDLVINRIHDLSDELNLNYNELKEKLIHYIEGKKVELEKPIYELIDEIHRIRKQQFDFAY